MTDVNVKLKIPPLDHDRHGGVVSLILTTSYVMRHGGNKIFYAKYAHGTIILSSD